MENEREQRRSSSPSLFIHRRPGTWGGEEALGSAACEIIIPATGEGLTYIISFNPHNLELKTLPPFHWYKHSVWGGLLPGPRSQYVAEAGLEPDLTLHLVLAASKPHCFTVPASVSMSLVPGYALPLRWARGITENSWLQGTVTNWAEHAFPHPIPKT